MRYLDLADFLVIASAILGIPEQDLALASRLHLAESALAAPQASFGGHEAYPEFARKVAVLGWHIIKNHPLPDGNKRTGFMCMVEFAERNGHRWNPDRKDEESAGEATADLIEKVAAGEVDVEALGEWVRARLGETD